MADGLAPTPGTIASGARKLSGGVFVSGKPADGGGLIPLGKSADYVARAEAYKNLAQPGGARLDTTIIAAEQVAAAGTAAAPVLATAIAEKSQVGGASPGAVIRVGDYVHVSVKSVSGPLGTSTYQWRNGTTPIAGATNAKFRVLTAAADLNCLVSISNGVGGTITLASNNLTSVLAS